MIRYVLRRLMWTVPMLFIITFLVFVAIRIGTNPVASYLRLNPRASVAKVEQYKKVNGLEGTSSPSTSRGCTTSSPSIGDGPSRAAGRCGRS
jgi:ABC-type dipeptide/oligopeptide/nickel transport system permease component